MVHDQNLAYWIRICYRIFFIYTISQFEGIN